MRLQLKPAFNKKERRENFFITVVYWLAKLTAANNKKTVK
jgi:hypothetical protein